MDKFLVKRPREEAAASSSDTAQAARTLPPAQAARTMGPAAADLFSQLGEGSWKEALAGEFAKDYFESLATKVATERKAKKVYPAPDKVFQTMNLTPLNEVRVVILGQDPYINPGQAHGLAFSVSRGIDPPPSLKNIYTELEADIPGFKRPSHGCLEEWGCQGVLMLNASLTVRAGESNSHKDWGWQVFTDAIVEKLNRRAGPPIVFLLWGGFAKKKAQNINRSRHVVIETAHPSPLSVTKWRGCKCFSACNEALKKKGLPEVDWRLSK